MEDELFGKARLGIHAERFYQSEVGQALIARAALDKRNAIEELADADVTNVESIRKIQLSIQLPKLALKWIGDIINEGRASEVVIQAQDSME
jgi:hypothetical protein